MSYDDRRESERVSVAYLGEFHVPGTDTRGTARVADLSEGGAKLYTDEPIEPGAALCLRLDRPMRTVVVSGSVVSSEPSEDGENFAVGCVFD